MSTASIGIKLADGSFYPILREGTPSKKKLELTTVRDFQTTVQINLYKSFDLQMLGADYVGTLIIENLIPHEKQEPTIDLLISIDDDDILSAEALDRESGNHNGLTVALKQLNENERFDFPDYAFQNQPITSDSFATRNDIEETDPLNSFDNELYTDIAQARKSPKKGLFIIILVTALIALILALVLLLTGVLSFDSLTGKKTTKPVAQTEISQSVIESIQDVIIVEKPAQTPQIESIKPQESSAPQLSEAQAAENTVVIIESPVVTPTKPARLPVPEGKQVYYTIRWGDTLWDIANAYYRNPWLYTIIAKANGIKNPNIIVAGTSIVIPPR